MELMLALLNADGGERHVKVSFHPGVTVREVAKYLAPWAGMSDSQPYRIRSLDRNLTVDGGRDFAASGLLSGELVALETPGKPSPKAPVLGLTIRSGPDSGKTARLGGGNATIGRARTCHIRLSDQTVSREHVELCVLSHGGYLLRPLSATNSTLIDGQKIASETTLTGIHEIQLGTSELVIYPLGRKNATAGGDGYILQTPSPRLVQPSPSIEVPWPDPPHPARPQRLPMISALAPLLIAGITYAITLNVLSLLFAILSPVIALLSHVESRIHRTKEHAELLTEWRAASKRLRERIGALEDDERRRREYLYPESQELVRWIQTASVRIWERQREQADSLTLRVGRGSNAAPWTIKPSASGPADLVAEAAEHITKHSKLADVPLCLDFAAQSSVSLRISSKWQGTTDSDHPLEDVMSSIVLQAATLISPVNLLISAALHPTVVPQWDWLKWLPHTQSSEILGNRLIATDHNSASTLARSLTAVLTQRSDELQKNRERRQWPLILVLIDPGRSTIPPEFLRLTRDASPQAGVVFLFLDRKRTAIAPGATSAISLTSAHEGILSYPSSAEHLFLSLESVPAGMRETAGRLLAGFRDLATESARETILPSSVSLTDLVGFQALHEPQFLCKNWNARQRTLSAAVGRSAEGPVEIDLRVDGPHGLVAGTTGSGKSEFLQSLVASFAIRHSPRRLNFLLVDYKGGAAFKDCRDLVHTVGLVTDLDGHLVARVLTSLRAELHYRERLLASFNARDIVQMEKESADDAPPNLLVIVDEFAALSREVPEFVEGMVDIAQRGRSLGIHMLLATQRPAGVVTDNIRANTNLRVALRVSDPSESTDVIAVPVAAQFDRRIPGRAALRIGPSELILFQSAYVGGRSRPTSRSANVTARPFRVDAEISAHASADPTDQRDKSAESEAVDLVRIVSTVNTAAEMLVIPPPRRPWLPELPSVLNLEKDLDLPINLTQLAIGLADDPSHQAQKTAKIDLQKMGNLLVCGMSGAGKSFFLRTLAAAAGIQTSEQINVYGLDCSGHALRLVESLPQVGSVIPGADIERTTRLLQVLRAEVDSRRELLDKYSANDLIELRSRSPELGDLPRIIVLLDGLHTFLDSYDRVEGGSWVEQLAQLMADGRAAGVHFVIATDRRSGIPLRFASLASSQLILRLASGDEYLAAGVPPGALGKDPPPGRAFFDGLELQLATLDGAITGDEQVHAYENLAERLVSRHSPPARPIGSLPSEVRMIDLPIGCVGISGGDLQPFSTPEWSIAGIFGPPKSGRTTALITLGEVTARRSPGRPILLVTDQALVDQKPAWISHHLVGNESAVKAIEELIELIDKEPNLNPLLLVDDVTELLDSSFDDALDRLLSRSRSCKFSVLVSGEAGSIRQSYLSSISRIRKAKNGVLLMPDIYSDGEIFSISLPRTVTKWYPGRGYMISNSQISLVQLAK